MECSWEFHDFRPERIEFISGKDIVEILLKYDTGIEGVLLRFSGIYDAHININRDYEADWLNGSVAFLLEDSSIIWLDDDSWGDSSKEHLEEIKQYTTWVQADRIFWAVTNADGKPVEMPADRIDQVWRTYGEEEKKHFGLKEFQEDWDAVYKPHY